MKAEPIAINLIRITAESQSRAATDRRTVEEYAQAWKLDADFPPVDLFTDGKFYYPGDGIHRILAAKLAGRVAILAYVHRGNAREAFLHGCASNQTHGLRRTNRDKRHMVSRMLNDAEWVKWSDRRIAEQCGVSGQFVANLRHELSTVDGSAAHRHAGRPRLCADGKFRKPPELNGGQHLPKSSPKVRRTEHFLAVGIQGRSTRGVDRNGNLDAQRQEALVLLEKLQQLLYALDMFECCAYEVQSIREKVGKLSLAGISA